MGKFKKILLIAGLIIATGLLAYGLYYFFKSTGPITQIPTGGVTAPATTTGFTSTGGRVTVTTTPGEEPMIVLPSAGVINNQQPGIFEPAYSKQVVTGSASNASVNLAGDIRYYNESDGKFYKTLPDGTKQTLSEKSFYNVKNVIWGNSTDKAVLEYPDGSKILFNFNTDKQVTLPKHWEEFVFSPNDDKIAAKSLGLSPENRWLVTMNDDGTGTELVNALGDNADKVTTSWSPNQKSVAFSLTGEALGAYREEVLLVGLNGENFKSFVAEGLDFQPKWSETGNKLIYSVYGDRTDYKPEVWIVDANGSTIGNNRQSLEINTWADKCTFAGDSTVYCAIPRSLPTGAGITPSIANDYYDDIYKIDLQTGYKTALTTGGDYTVDSLQYNDATGRLIFTDASKAGVYEITL